MMAIASYIIGKVVDILPTFLLRFFFPLDKVSQKVCIELRGEEPISISLNADIPQIDLWFKATNLSHFNIILDRLLIEIWFGQPTFNAVILNRYSIPPLSVIDSMYCNVFLTAEQKKRIENYQVQHSDGIKINLTAYFDSKIGTVEVKKTIERWKL